MMKIFPKVDAKLKTQNCDVERDMREKSRQY